MPNGEWGLLHSYLVVGALVFSVGLVGFITRRNLIVIFLSAEMMLQGVSLSLVAWGRFHNDWGGQMLVVFIVAVAAAEAAIALALILILFRRVGKLDVTVWQHLREANQPTYVDTHLPKQLIKPAVWPKLPTAGVEPPRQPDEEGYRPHV